MTKTFEWTLKSGGSAKIVASYEAIMESREAYLDGHVIIGEPEPTTTEKTNMELYVDGKKVDSCWNPNFWVLNDAKAPAVKKIWGMCASFAKIEDANRYEAFVSDLIESGTSDEVKAYNAEKARIKKERDIAEAKRIIEKAESQADIPTVAELDKKIRRYNNTYNEGGEGYVPDWVSREQYDAAKKTLKELSDKS